MPETMREADKHILQALFMVCDILATVDSDGRIPQEDLDGLHTLVRKAAYEIEKADDAETVKVQIAVVVNSDGEWDCGRFDAEPDLDRISLGSPRTLEAFHIVKVTLPVPDRIAATITAESVEAVDATD